MLFNSLHFAIFFPIVFLIYWAISDRFRWILLLIASYYFYMSWNASFALLILFVTVVSWLAGILMEKYSNNATLRKRVMIVAVILCFAVLFIFKYLGFFGSIIEAAVRLVNKGWHAHIIQLMLPVGISFYTFQTVSYIVDVYKGRVEAEHHFGYYATFVSFFPQLVAGPIERTSNLLPQIKSSKSFSYENGVEGAQKFIWGLYKKIVIADNLSNYVDAVFGNITQYTGLSLLLASFFFTIQIYCDFSGYSDMAIGAAKLLDINLMENFKSPYLADGIKSFWSRWHISLSTWFRDYVYIPLGGNRVSKPRHYFNLMATFLLSGLWHGASWNFVVWGGAFTGLRRWLRMLLDVENGERIS